MQWVLNRWNRTLTIVFTSLLFQTSFLLPAPRQPSESCVYHSLATWKQALLLATYITELQQLRSCLGSLFTVKLAIALHSDQHVTAQSLQMAVSVFTTAAGQAIFNMYPLLCWRAAAAAVSLWTKNNKREVRDSNGKCNWNQLSHKWAGI